MVSNPIVHSQGFPKGERYEGSLDFLSLTDLLYGLLDALWGRGWGTFTMEKPKTLDAKDVEFPMIVIQLEKMEPGDIGNGRVERKPRQRGSRTFENKETGETRTVTDYGQRMDGQLVFTVYAESNLEAIELSQSFMDVVHRYKGLLMKHGLQNIWFTREEAMDVMSREDITARNIIYHTTFEYIYRGNPDTLNEFEIKADTVMDSLRKEGKLPSQQ